MTVTPRIALSELYKQGYFREELVHALFMLAASNMNQGRHWYYHPMVQANVVPRFYMMLAAPSGSGKSLLSKAIRTPLMQMKSRGLWQGHFAPDDSTYQAVIDNTKALQEMLNQKVVNAEDLKAMMKPDLVEQVIDTTARNQYQYKPILTIFCDYHEGGTILPNLHQMAIYASVIYDGLTYTEAKRGNKSVNGKGEVEHLLTIETHNLVLNLAIQPVLLRNWMQEKQNMGFYQQGIVGRSSCFFLDRAEHQKEFADDFNIFDLAKEDYSSELLEQAVTALDQINGIPSGAFSFTAEAGAEITKIYKAGDDAYGKVEVEALESLRGRRLDHLLSYSCQHALIDLSKVVTAEHVRESHQLIMESEVSWHRTYDFTSANPFTDQGAIKAMKDYLGSYKRAHALQTNLAPEASVKRFLMEHAGVPAYRLDALLKQMYLAKIIDQGTETLVLPDGNSRVIPVMKLIA